VVDRASLSAWQNGGGQTAFQRAHTRVGRLLASYQPRPLSEDVRRGLEDITLGAARQFGMDRLPAMPPDGR
jgi:trimethylamine:corrinoid methyltransferase-like protein